MSDDPRIARVVVRRVGDETLWGIILRALASAPSMTACACRELSCIAVVLRKRLSFVISGRWIGARLATRVSYLAHHPELLETEGTANYFAKQLSRPVIGMVTYLMAAAAGWLLHPTIALAVFAFMVLYHASTSQGRRVRERR